MKRLFFLLFALFFLVVNCGDSNSPYYNVTVQQSAADGLDLKAVMEILKSCKNAEEFEKKLNQPQGVNNLDLNLDGKTDYIKVDEYSDGKIRGFSLTTEPNQGEIQEIATIEIQKEGEQAQVQARGNEQIYGQNHYYHSRFSFTDFLIMSYLLRPHPFYSSPFRWGYYPSYYGMGYPVRSYYSYRSNVRTYTKNSRANFSKQPQFKPSRKSPNTGKTASSIKAPLKNPTKSQKSFQARSRSKSTRSGGFGRKTSKPSVRSSGFRRSGGSFGGK